MKEMDGELRKDVLKLTHGQDRIVMEARLPGNQNTAVILTQAQSKPPAKLPMEYHRR